MASVRIRGARTERFRKSRPAEAVQRRGGDPEGGAGAAGGLVVHLAGRDAGGGERGHDRSAGDAHVEVEVEDAAAEELVEGPQAADLVDRAGDSAAGADQGDLFGRALSGAASAGWPAPVLLARESTSRGPRVTPGRALAVALALEAVDLAGELVHLPGEGLDLLPARDVERGEGALHRVVHRAREARRSLRTSFWSWSIPAVDLPRGGLALSRSEAGGSTASACLETSRVSSAAALGERLATRLLDRSPRRELDGPRARVASTVLRQSRPRSRRVRPGAGRAATVFLRACASSSSCTCFFVAEGLAPAGASCAPRRAGALRGGLLGW